MPKNETTESQVAEQTACSPSGWPVVEIEAALERLRNELHGDDRMAVRVVAFAVNHPFEEVQRSGGAWKFVRKILEQESPEAFKALGSPPLQGKRPRQVRLPKAVLRRVRSGEIVQWPVGGPFWGLKEVHAASEHEHEPRQGPPAAKLEDPEAQAIVEELSLLKEKGDQLLDELTPAERLRYTKKLWKLEQESKTLSEQVEFTTDEVQKTRALARERRVKADQDKRAEKARAGIGQKKKAEDALLVPLVLRMKHERGMSERAIVEHINRLIDDCDRRTLIDNGDGDVRSIGRIGRKRVRRILRDNSPK